MIRVEDAPKKKFASLLAAGGLAAVGVLAAAKITARRTHRRVDLRNKVTLITGGSRGLGLALALELGQQGSVLALCARDDKELEQACSQLREKGIEAVAFPGDITSKGEPERLIESVVDRFGRIDILVNDAGLIKVGPFDSFDLSDFEKAMNLMFWAPVNLSRAALGQMKKQGEGYIVNITSVGGRVSVPHLLPYSCAKFAIVGFSTGLSAEVADEGVHVLTVVPGLMRTGSYLNADFTGAAKEEFAWFGLLGNMPGFSVAAEYAATRIRSALENREYTCTISLPAKILIACDTILPEVTRNIFYAVNRLLLPQSTSHRSFTGKQLNAQLNQVFQTLTTLGRTAAKQLNE